VWFQKFISTQSREGVLLAKHLQRVIPFQAIKRRCCLAVFAVGH
jgi:hypothetical protein